MYCSLQLEPFVDDSDEWQDGPSPELSEFEIEAAYLGWAADNHRWLHHRLEELPTRGLDGSLASDAHIRESGRNREFR